MTGKDVNRLKDDICRYSRLLYRRGLVGAAGGNVSARAGRSIFVTAGGKSLRDTVSDDIIEVDEEGNSGGARGGLSPSKELFMHLNIYRVRSDVDSVIHVHPVYATSYAVRGISIPMATATARLKLRRIPVVDDAHPGSPELSELVRKKIMETGEDTNSLLLSGHGIITFCQGMEECFNTAELIEETAKIAYISGNIKC
jgi:L-fuculose-phosphate aldolase